MPRPIQAGRRSVAGLVAMLVLAVAVCFLNLQRFRVDTPRVAHISQEAVAIGALQSDICKGDVERVVIVAATPEPALLPALASSSKDGKTPRVLSYRSLPSGRPFPVGSARCIILAEPNEPRTPELTEELSKRYPAGQLYTFTDYAGKGRVLIYAIAPA